jgi:hypothetical protein
MSSALPATPTADCCVEPCDEVAVQQVAGPAGAAGAAGTNGTNGINAFTTTTSNFTVPAELATVTINVAKSDWAALSQVLYIQNAGWYRVTAIPGTTQLTVRNLEDAANDAYLENAAPATVVTSGAKVCPGGLQGPEGTGSGDLLAANNLSDLASVATARTNLGLAIGTNVQAFSANLSTFAGIAPSANVQSILGAANYSAIRTQLGLVIGANVQAWDAELDTLAGATITAAGFAILDDADAAAQRITLGLQRSPQDLLVYEHQAATTVNGGDFTSGAWRTVPLSTEVADTGGHGSIAASVITLAAGAYRFRARVCGYQVGNFQCRLFNVDTAAIIQYGSNTTSAAADGCQEYSLIEGRFTLAVSTQLRLEAQCQTTNTGDGFGVANSFGGTEIYSAIAFEREAG